MSEPNIWDKITAYMAENQSNTAREAESLQKDENRTIIWERDDDFIEDQKLDCIYDDEPLGFEEDPMGSTAKMRALDPLEEVDIGDGSIKRPTYVSTKIPKEFRDRIV